MKRFAFAFLILFGIIFFTSCGDGKEKEKEKSEENKEALKRAFKEGFEILSEEIEKHTTDTTSVNDTASVTNGAVKLWKVWDQSAPLRDKKKLCRCAIDIYRDLNGLIGKCDDLSASFFVQTVAKCVYGENIPSEIALIIAHHVGICDMCKKLDNPKGRKLLRRILSELDEQCKKL